MEQRAFNEVKMLVQCAQDHCHILLSYAKNAPSIWMVTDGCVEIAGIWRWERLSCNHPNQLHGSGVVLITIHLLLLVSLWLLRDFRCIQSTKIYWGGGRSLYTFCYDSEHLFHFTFHFHFRSHSCFMRLVSYIHFSLTLLEAAHLTPSSCSTMMIPSLFLPLYTINTRDVVDCKLTYS